MARKCIDITGNKYGRLTAVERHGTASSGGALWFCRCDCGKTAIAKSIRLRNGVTISCGCFKNPPSNFIDRTGTVYSHLTVLKQVGNNEHSQTKWLCRCECGKETVVLGNSLGNNHTRSCGCIHKERARLLNRTHGLSDHPGYKMWQASKQRAQAKDIPHSLTVEFVCRLYDETVVCPVLKCGIELKSNNGIVASNSPSLDRLIPELGYVENNVNIICHGCNTIKQSATPERLKGVADWVSIKARDLR